MIASVTASVTGSVSRMFRNIVVKRTPQYTVVRLDRLSRRGETFILNQILDCGNTAFRQPIASTVTLRSTFARKTLQPRNLSSLDTDPGSLVITFYVI